MVTSLTIGASSTAASPSPSARSSSCSLASAVSASTDPSIAPNLRMAATTSAAVATTGWMSRPVIVRMSSSAYTLAGSDIATRSTPSRSAYGRAR